MRKILYDIEQLLQAKGKETGVCRVSLQVLKQLSSQKEYQVYPLVTIKDDSAKAYLQSKGLDALADRVVVMSHLNKTTKRYNWRQKIKSNILMAFYGRKYQKEIEKYDEYISLFSPISEIVYRSRIQTKMFVHDLIPIKFPQFSAPQIAVKYGACLKGIKADEVICVSNATKKDFLAFRPTFDEKKVKVAYLAADERFRPTFDPKMKEKYGIKTPRYFLAVSELNERKNFEHLVRAFLLFLKKTNNQDVSLVIVGVKRAGYEKLNDLLATQKEFKERIVLTGYVSDEDMPALYSEAAVFVYPSLYEGFGLPVLEAMQCGTAVICANNSSLPEVGGDAVKYISGKDEEETAQALADLYENEALRHELGQKGRDRSLLFSWKQTVARIFDEKRNLP